MTTRQRQLKRIEKLNADLQAFAKETGEEVATLYEDIYTSYTLSDIELKGDWLSYVYDGVKQTQGIIDDDDLEEWLVFWRACLNRAKRYWATDSDTLDKMSDGLKQDIEVYN